MKFSAFTPKTLLTLCLLTVGTPALAKAFKWIDADGNVHYTSTPPPEAGQVQEIPLNLPPSGSLYRQEAEEEPQEAAPDPVDQQEAENIAKKCKAARKMLPRVVRKMEQMIRQGVQDGSINREEYNAFVAKKSSMQTVPAQADCVEDYNNVDSSRKLVNCLAAAEGDTNSGIHCMTMEHAKEAVAEGEAQAKAKQQQQE